MAEKKVALLVLNYNGERFLPECFSSLLSQKYSNFKAFLIDNCSSDNSVDLAKKNFPQVRIIENRRNLGVGAAFNRAIRRLKNKFDYLALFNADIKVDKNWLKTTTKILNDYSEAEICASLVLEPDGKKVDTAGGMIANLFCGMIYGFGGGMERKEFSRLAREKKFPVFAGLVTAMLIRSTAFGRVGYFDEDYFMYFEDIDFSWRVLLSGGKIFCQPKAVVYHYGRGSKTDKKLNLKILSQTETNLMATYFKNMQLSTFILVFPFLLTSRLIFALFYFPFSPKITTAKFLGIALFVRKMLFGNYAAPRRQVRKIRKLSDIQVFKNNPGPIIAFSWFRSKGKSWLKHILSVYNREDERKP